MSCVGVGCVFEECLGGRELWQTGLLGVEVVERGHPGCLQRQIFFGCHSLQSDQSGLVS